MVLGKWWLEGYFPIGMVIFQGRTVKLRGSHGGLVQMIFLFKWLGDF